MRGAAEPEPLYMLPASGCRVGNCVLHGLGWPGAPVAPALDYPARARHGIHLRDPKYVVTSIHALLLILSSCLIYVMYPILR